MQTRYLSYNLCGYKNPLCSLSDKILSTNKITTVNSQSDARIRLYL